MSKASVDFPEPLTPVTTVSAFSGTLTSIFLRLFCRAPRIWINWSRAPEADRNPRLCEVSLAGGSFIVDDTFPIRFGESAGRRSNGRSLLCQERAVTPSAWHD